MNGLEANATAKRPSSGAIPPSFDSIPTMVHPILILTRSPTSGLNSGLEGARTRHRDVRLWYHQDSECFPPFQALIKLEPGSDQAEGERGHRGGGRAVVGLGANWPRRRLTGGLGGDAIPVPAQRAAFCRPVDTRSA